jgi:RHS repeat-associated protein
VSGQNYATTYANDSFRKPVSITYPSGRTLSYNRESNTLGLASITDQYGTYLNNISYNAAGLAWQFYLGNGVIDGFIYDNAPPGLTGNRLQMTGLVGTSPGGTPGNLMTLNYNYQASAGQLGTGTSAGNAGRLMSVSGTINGQTENAVYGYDLNGRLVTSAQTSNGASAQRRFAYDRWGNRTGEWDATSGGNQLQNITLQQSGGAPTNGIATVSTAGESVYNTPGQCGSPATVNVDRTGRYVMVQLMGANYLHLAEVQVIGTSGQNLALGKPSVQSSTVLGATASRANDGNTDGNFADGSVSHTDLQYLPWWYVDLGSSQQITSINVWNRTDCCSSRTSNFNVIVSDQPIATRTYLYDAAGNLWFDGAHSYQYDAENRMVSVDNGATARYYYDFRNRRVQKVTAGTVRYVWEGGKVLAEHDGTTGSVLVDYIYSGHSPIAKVAGGITNYFISDRLSVRMTLDTSGNVVGRQAHLPFGEDFAESGQQEKHHFTRYESDAESGLDYAVNRFYAESVGRFMSADPYKQSGYVVDPQSWNRYSYAGGNPVNLVDPAGLFLIAPPPICSLPPVVSYGDIIVTSGTVGVIDGGLGLGGGSVNPPVPQQSYQGLNDCEKRLAWQTNFGDWNMLQDAQQAGYRAGRDSGLPGLLNGPADAVRHCTWNCEMTRGFRKNDYPDYKNDPDSNQKAWNYSRDKAQKWGDAHECDTQANGQKNPTDEKDMDLFNNNVGRNLADQDPSKSCFDLCMDAQKNGQLKVLPPDRWRH